VGALATGDGRLVSTFHVGSRLSVRRLSNTMSDSLLASHACALTAVQAGPNSVRRIVFRLLGHGRHAPNAMTSFEKISRKARHFIKFAWRRQSFCSFPQGRKWPCLWITSGQKSRIKGFGSAGRCRFL
jgi:hypothetical protein